MKTSEAGLKDKSEDIEQIYKNMEHRKESMKRKFDGISRSFNIQVRSSQW